MVVGNHIMSLLRSPSSRSVSAKHRCSVLRCRFVFGSYSRSGRQVRFSILTGRSSSVRDGGDIPSRRTLSPIQSPAALKKKKKKNLYFSSKLVHKMCVSRDIPDSAEK